MEKLFLNEMTPAPISDTLYPKPGDVKLIILCEKKLVWTQYLETTTECSFIILPYLVLIFMSIVKIA